MTALPCRRIRTSLPWNRNAFGSRTAWNRPDQKIFAVFIVSPRIGASHAAGSKVDAVESSSVVDAGPPACSHRRLARILQDSRNVSAAMGGHPMNERELRGLLDQVKAGGLSRRGFVQRMAAVGFTAPMATQLLAYAGVAMAQSRPTYKPTKRGGGGLLKVLWWQGPTLLNPHFAVGGKDQEGSRLFYEPLAGWDGDGNLRPVLAETVPGRHDRTLAAGRQSATRKPKKGASWHDGQPL